MLSIATVQAVSTAAVPAIDPIAELAIQLGLRVRHFRKALSPPASQERLAELAGMHRTYIGRVERGEVNLTVYTMVRIAKALAVDPAELVREPVP